MKNFRSKQMGYFAGMIPWALTCLVFLSPVGAEDTAPIPDDKSKFHLFLLVGQSNMAGRGKLDDPATEVHPHVLTLDRSGHWVAAVDPLHFDKPNMVGVGLGKTFGLEYARRHPDAIVGLIPCAVGGSPIASWEPGVFYSATKSHPWDDAIARAELAMKSGTLKGILWHQGESDSNAKSAAVYEQKLHSLIKRFRKSLDAPEVPFVVGQMGQFAERPWSDERKKVDAVHRRLPETVAATAFASSDGLTDKGDLVHFDTKSYRELGRRYFQAFESIADQENR